MSIDDDPGTELCDRVRPNRYLGFEILDFYVQSIILSSDFLHKKFIRNNQVITHYRIHIFDMQIPDMLLREQASAIVYKCMMSERGNCETCLRTHRLTHLISDVLVGLPDFIVAVGHKNLPVSASPRPQ